MSRRQQPLRRASESPIPEGAILSQNPSISHKQQLQRQKFTRTPCRVTKNHPDTSVGSWLALLPQPQGSGSGEGSTSWQETNGQTGWWSERQSTWRDAFTNSERGTAALGNTWNGRETQTARPAGGVSTGHRRGNICSSTAGNGSDSRRSCGRKYGRRQGKGRTAM